MLTNKELRIIEIFRKRLFKTYTIREISKAVETTSYSWTFNAVKKLSKLGILHLEEKGHSKIVTINLNSAIAIKYLSLLDELEANEREIPNINEIFKIINTAYFTLIIAGSYAKGTETKNSDLDVIVITNDDTISILNTLKNKGGLLIPEVHPYVFTQKEFLEMLLAKEENYAKFIFKERLIFFGAENYYLTINEARKHGFNG
ncbi:MAG: nucleotidyltransferase domain-containing protein [Nanoarchaeota archaeon]|nr:nucleotidyltransferase domain-containing protein [Nanoarchaeota archaeon]MBU4451241.1 nucleotidyltransferase domain-containing protein [Nanoarchaeota archaeon]